MLLLPLPCRQIVRRWARAAERFGKMSWSPGYATMPFETGADAGPNTSGRLEDNDKHGKSICRDVRLRVSGWKPDFYPQIAGQAVS